MEFRDVMLRRRMVREFSAEPVQSEVLDRVLEAGLHAPSAGFAQGLELIVLEGAEQLSEFWRITDPRGRKHSNDRPPPVVVVPLTDKSAYLKRYAEPDKQGLGMDVEEGWPVPYWDLDAAMSVMLMLLAAVDEGLGAWFFGIFHGESALLECLEAPEGLQPIGALALGHPAPGERRRGSATKRPRRELEDVVHLGGWA
ncbi:MAG: nitroreductase family protein [Actinobacteria bacterium]|nr:nitroreductase family protein [Actinomycetota bacterium]